MATQESMREDTFAAGGDANAGRSAAQNERIEAGATGPAAGEGEWDDADAQTEVEEILLPDSLREGFAQVAEAVRNLVRTQPLGALFAAAGAAYLAGRLASRR
jgi:hypothetical protein